jgi:hypothetical protein
MAYAVRHGRTRPRQGLCRLVTSLTTRRNFDGEHAILAGDVTVQLAIGAARVALCSFIFNAGCSLVRHIDVGPVSSQPMCPVLGEDLRPESRRSHRVTLPVALCTQRRGWLQRQASRTEGANRDGSQQS